VVQDAVEDRCGEHVVSEHLAPQPERLALVHKDFITPLLPPSVDRPLLTIREVATTLGVCTATVYKLCDRGALRHVRVLYAIRVTHADLDALIGRTRRNGGPSEK
jgi:excisionase family DNA binding protein